MQTDGTLLLVAAMTGTALDERGSVGEAESRTIADLTDLTYSFGSKGSIGPQWFKRSLGMLWVTAPALDLVNDAPVLVVDPLEHPTPGNVKARN